MPTMPIARKGDKEATHCSTPRRKGAFRTVFANAIPVSGNGHKNTSHLKPCGKRCCGHSAPLIASQGTVFAEGRAVGKVGDATCTRVVQGSPNVFVGGPVGGGRRGGFGSFLSTALSVASFIGPVAPASGGATTATEGSF